MIRLTVIRVDVPLRVLAAPTFAAVARIADRTYYVDRMEAHRSLDKRTVIG